MAKLKITSDPNLSNFAIIDNWTDNFAVRIFFIETVPKIRCETNFTRFCNILRTEL